MRTEVLAKFILTLFFQWMMDGLFMDNRTMGPDFSAGTVNSTPSNFCQQK